MLHQAHLGTQHQEVGVDRSRAGLDRAEENEEVGSPNVAADKVSDPAVAVGVDSSSGHAAEAVDNSPVEVQLVFGPC